jgi:hypothetical protein
MRTRTQERIEELARARTARAIDLALVEEGIEIGKQMMAEMIAGYASTGASPSGAPAPGDRREGRAAEPPVPAVSSSAVGGYLNEVRSMSAMAPAPGAIGDAPPADPARGEPLR